MLLSFFISLQGSDETIRVVSMDKDYHVECYHCEVGCPLQTCEYVSALINKHILDAGSQARSEWLIKTNHSEQICHLNYSLSGNYILPRNRR